MNQELTDFRAKAYGSALLKAWLASLVLMFCLGTYVGYMHWDTIDKIVDTFIGSPFE